MFDVQSLNESVNSDEFLFKRIDREEYCIIDETLSKVDISNREEDFILDILIKKEIFYTKNSHIGWCKNELSLLIGWGYPYIRTERKSLKVQKYDDDYYVVLYWTGKEWLLYKCDTFDGVKDCLEELL